MRIVRLTDAFLLSTASRADVKREFPQIGKLAKRAGDNARGCCRGRTRERVMAMNALRDFVTGMPADRQDRLKIMLGIPARAAFK